jgi:hypothetical protein
VEALVIAGNFHDPKVKWTFRLIEDNYTLTIGSEKDRIRIIFSTEELQQIFAQYAESMLNDRVWISPAN